MISAIGLDPGVKSFGVALPDGSTRTISPRAGSKDPARRLNEILYRLSAYLRLCSGLEIAMIEGYDLGPRRGQLALVRLGELGGVVRGHLFELGIPYMEVPPKSLKLYATGNGNASKDDMSEAARACGAEAANHDEADAWWLWALARHHYAPSACEPAYRTMELRDARIAVRARLPWPLIDRTLRGQHHA